MQPYSHTTKSNFKKYKRFDVNSLDLREYTDIISRFHVICNVLGVGINDCMEACKVLKIPNSDILTIDYYPDGNYFFGKLLEKDCALRVEHEDNEWKRHEVYYSAYVVPAHYHTYVGKVVEYLLGKLFPQIFLNEAFFIVETKNVCVGELTLQEALDEFGNVPVGEISQKTYADSSKTYEKKKSRFSIYDIYDEKSYEIYLTTSSGSLYVPIRAIMQRDFNIIIERQTSYHKDYYKKSPEKLTDALAPLQSPEARLLLSLIS